ncbi:DUF692 domain-containing protein [Collimonas humicola]|uniref:MNIO family bufferin maturase n=1 Tax=Collimonas humicola TaxID=2825886 RepID=UPI001E5A0DFE|nr:DUF692 domain-containing protein [Collimonas humicola]
MRGLAPQPAKAEDAGALSPMPRLGLGLGLRNVHFDHILAEWPKVDWFEAISENFMDSGGRPRAVLRRIAERYPIALHGVSLSIGSTDPLNRSYLARLRQLADEVSPRWVSDHLCWSGMQGINSHDLLPLPLNEDTLAHVIARVAQAQELLGRPLVLENPSTYLRFRDSSIDEPAFLGELCRATGCWLLLDVNNVYVSCFNAGTDPWDYLERFPFKRVVQLHLAGHQHCGTHIVDTHDRPVCDAVWQLFRKAWQRSGGAATLLEWDGDVPPFERVHAELMLAQKVLHGDTPTSPMPSPQSQSDTAEALSTPVDFLVPRIMGSSALYPP